MTPTLLGRLQTRLFLVVAIGLPWTLLVSPIVTALGGGSWASTLRLTVAAVLIMGVLGLAIWEPLYHWLQQYRWEKDWPTGLGLVTVLNEAVLTWLALATDFDVPTAAFVFHIGSTWLVMWFVANGPLRVLALRWRYRGGRFV